MTVDPAACPGTDVGAGRRPRCPLCADNTAVTNGAERCVRPECPAQRIKRNNRGDAWALDANRKLVYQPNRHPVPTDEPAGRATPRFEADLPTNYDTDDVLLARMFGTTGFSVKGGNRQ